MAGAGPSFSRLSRSDRASVGDIEARLQAIPDVMPGNGAVPPWLVPDLAQLLGCKLFVAYRPSRDLQGGWVLGEKAAHGEGFARYDAELGRTSQPFNYDPRQPEARQRNRVYFFDEVHTHGPEQTCAVEDIWPKVGLQHHDQIRALVCEGTTLLAWVEGFREEPFVQRERDVFTALLPALRRALSLRRRLLDAAVCRAGLEHAMEALGAPAFVADREGQVWHANQAAAALLERSPRATREHLREEVARARGATFVARISAPGVPARFLVVVREEPDAEARIRAATARWKLTVREAETLRRVVRGDSNKEIAIRLRCHEGSVERHVTSLLRKSRCDGRSRLVAQFWTTL